MKLMRVSLTMWALALAVLFAFLSTLVPRLILMTVLNGVFLGVVVAAMIVYAPLIWLAFHKTRFDRVSQLSLGIGLLFFSVAASKLYWIVWRMNDSPDSWRSNPFLQGLAYIAIIGGCLFVTAPGYPPEHPSEAIAIWGKNRRLLFLFGGIGGVITCVVSFWSDNSLF